MLSGVGGGVKFKELLSSTELLKIEEVTFALTEG